MSNGIRKAPTTAKVGYVVVPALTTTACTDLSTCLTEHTRPTQKPTRSLPGAGKPVEGIDDSDK